jgi:NADPH-dependent 2,4-dienoyl-CoA reductase/sulfur reductase-like enzyme
MRDLEQVSGTHRCKPARRRALFVAGTALLLLLLAWQPLALLYSHLSNHKRSDMPPVVAIVGGGLAGLAAALEASSTLATEQPAARILLLEKAPTLGGNSAKASSGINVLNPEGGDSEELFAADTRRSGGGRSVESLVSQLAVRGRRAGGRQPHRCVPRP